AINSDVTFLDYVKYFRSRSMGILLACLSLIICEDLVVASPVEDYFIHIDDLPSPEKVKTSTHTFHIRRGRRKTYSPLRSRAISSPRAGRRNVSPHGEKKLGDNWHSLQDKDGQAIIIAAQSIVKGEENPLLALVGFCQCGKPDALDFNFCRLLFRISMRISLTMRDRPFLPITALDACAKGAWRRCPECELEREKSKVYMVGNQQIVESMVGGSLIPFQCF
ncbi:hypothetical protein BHM03_00027617, partial [Ensete ventricosum]